MTKLTPILGIIALSGITAAAVTTGTLHYANAPTTPPKQSDTRLPAEIGSPRDYEAKDSPIVRTVASANNSVVSVIVSKDMPKMERYFEAMPFDRDLFNGFFGGSPFDLQIPRIRQNGTEKREIGGGTAFFVTSDGLLMTNKHVVDDPDAEYTVFLNDGRKLTAKVVGRDPTNDVALLKVDGKDFTPVQFAEGADPLLGETVVAIGNALGEFRNTVSVGVVSGLRRNITAGDIGGAGSERLNSILQTDAAINRGNSGGPLLDLAGKVIGMNTAVANGAQNIAFAIPASDLRQVLKSYEANGRIVRPYLGVRYATITPEVKKQNSLTVDYGVIVVRGDTQTDLAVIPGSPADKAGLRENDIILEVDGQKLDEDHALNTTVLTHQPGDTLRLKILRQGKEQVLNVKLEEWKE